MSSEEDLSPEEKLLRVIQDNPDDESESDEADAPAKRSAEPAETEEPTVVVGAPLDEDALFGRPEDAGIVDDVEPGAQDEEEARPRLKLADRSDDAEADEDQADEESGEESGEESSQVAALAITEQELGAPPGALIGESSSDGAAAALAGQSGSSVFRNRLSESFNVHIFNRILAVGVLILIALIVYEIFTGLKSSRTTSGIQTAGVSFDGDGVTDFSLKDMVVYTESVRKRDIFKAFADTPTGPGPTPPPDWKKYATDNYEIIFVSIQDDSARSEVFIKDKVISENSLFRVGDAVNILGDKVRVDEIKREGVTLTDGVDRLIIK